MVHYNGYAILDHRETGSIISMDASKKGEVGGRAGIAAFNFERQEFFHCPVPAHLQHLDIADLELLVHLVSARVWGHSWGGYNIQGFTDSQPTQHLLMHGRSNEDKSPARLEMARQFWFLETKFDFVWQSEYVSTKNNHHSDALSRWGDYHQREKFYKLIENTAATEITISDDMFNFKDDI